MRLTFKIDLDIDVETHHHPWTSKMCFKEDVLSNAYIAKLKIDLAEVIQKRLLMDDVIKRDRFSKLIKFNEDCFISRVSVQIENTLAPANTFYKQPETLEL